MASTLRRFDSRAVGIESLVRVVVVVALFVGLTLSTGVVGALIGVCVGLGWWFLPGCFAFGFGQVAVAATGTGLGGPGGLLAQTGLWGLLVAELSTAHTGSRLRALRDITLGSLSAVAAAWLLGELVDPLWKVVLALGVLSAGCFYAIHRYQLVRMGLVGETT